MQRITIANRRLGLERLESRTLLSADGLGGEWLLSEVRIVDNGEPGYSTVGSWSRKTGSGHDGDFDSKGRGTGAAAAVWTFDVVPGRYQVSATWATNRRAATNAEYAVLADETAGTPVAVNQRLRPGGFEDGGSWWQNLGKPVVATGSTLVVQLSDRANGRVAADAIRVERLPDIPVLEIWDGPALLEPGQVVDFGVTPPGFAVDKALTVRNGGTLDLTVQPPAALLAGFTLVAGPGATELAPGESTTLTVRMESAETEDLAGSLTLVSNDPEQGRLELPLAGKVTPVRIADNGAAGYSAVGRWSRDARNGYGNDSAYKAKGKGNAAATWTFDVLPGRYLISATWPPGSRAATNAQYTVVADGEARLPVAANQRLRPGDLLDEGSAWQHLGRPVVVTGGTLAVRLSDWANGRVTADAVRIERLPDVPLLEVWDGPALFEPGGVVDFGVTPPGFASERTLTVRNGGTLPLSVQPPAALPAGFRLAEQPDKTELAPGEETAFTLLMGAQADEQLGGAIVLASNSADDGLFALELTGAVSTVQIVDDGDAGYATAAKWSRSAGAGFADDHELKRSGRGNNAASWTFDVPPGLYRVSATWPASGKAATNSPFSVYDGAERLRMVPVNQRLAPGDFQDSGVGWQDLGGPYLVAGNTLEVRLVDQANGRLLADAVRIERLNPQAVDDVFTALPNTPLWIPAAGVLANDFAGEAPRLLGSLTQESPDEALAAQTADGPLSASLISGPAHGSLTLNADGSFHYTPAAGFTGSDWFTYQASDGISPSNEATVTIDVQAELVLEFVSHSGSFQLAPGEAVDVTLRVASAAALDGFELDFHRSETAASQLLLSHWTTAADWWSLDATLDTPSDTRVAGAALSPLPGPRDLGTFRLTAPATPGQYLLSIDDRRNLLFSTKFRSSGDSAPVGSYGDVLVDVGLGP